MKFLFSVTARGHEEAAEVSKILNTNGLKYTEEMTDSPNGKSIVRRKRQAIPDQEEVLKMERMFSRNSKVSTKELHAKFNINCSINTFQRIRNGQHRYSSDAN